MEIKPRAMRDTLLEAIYEKMKSDESIFFVTADFGSPVLDKIRSDCPDQFVNVGIAEQNLINVSAGLALEGYTVFAYAIAPFITMRCFEQIRVNIALLSNVREMNVNLIGVGAGYSYVVSGPTHQCYEDLTLMRSMPNMEVLSPADQVSAASLLETCVASSGPSYLRLDAQILEPIYDGEFAYPTEGFVQLEEGKTVCLISTGYMTHTAQQVRAQIKELIGVEVGLIDMINISGFDAKALLDRLNAFDVVVSLEEGFKGCGGLDAKILTLLNENNCSVRFESVAVEGGYRFEIGGRQELHEDVGIGVDTVTNRLINIMKEI